MLWEFTWLQLSSLQALHLLVYFRLESRTVCVCVCVSPHAPVELSHSFIFYVSLKLRLLVCLSSGEKRQKQEEEGGEEARVLGELCADS